MITSLILKTMQTILLNIIHPNGKQTRPVQIPVAITAAHLLQYLNEQGFLAPGKYRLSARGKALDPNRALGEYGLQQQESLQVNYAFRPPQFEGGRGKGIFLRYGIQQEKEVQQQESPAREKPSSKGFFAWLFS